MAELDLDSLRDDYRDVVHLAEGFAHSMKQEVEKLLSNDSVPLGIPLVCRVKTLESVLEKTRRLGFPLQRVSHLNDLVGLRIMPLFRQDLEKVCSLVSKAFDVISKEDIGEKLGEAQFGYLSIHYVVKIPESWLSVPSFQGFGELKAEIQIRTLAQHIWAEASHKLQYKNAASVPLAVRRAIYRLSALLETADLELDRVLTEQRSYLTEIDSIPPDERPDEPLNADLLARILDKALPPGNKAVNDEYSELADELVRFGVNTSGKLRELIEKHLDHAMQEESRAPDEVFHTELTEAEDIERTRRGVFYTHVGLVRLMLDEAFGEPYKEYRRLGSGMNFGHLQ